MPSATYKMKRGIEEYELSIDYKIAPAEPDVGIPGAYPEEWTIESVTELSTSRDIDPETFEFGMTEDEQTGLEEFLANEAANYDGDG